MFYFLKKLKSLTREQFRILFNMQRIGKKLKNFLLELIDMIRKGIRLKERS